MPTKRRRDPSAWKSTMCDPKPRHSRRNLEGRCRTLPDTTCRGEKQPWLSAATRNPNPNGNDSQAPRLFLPRAEALKSIGRGDGTDVPRASLPACPSQDRRDQNHSAKHWAETRMAQKRGLPLTATARATTPYEFSSSASHFFRAWPWSASTNRQRIAPTLCRHDRARCDLLP